VSVKSARIPPGVFALPPVAGTIPFALSDDHTSKALLGLALPVRGFGFGSACLDRIQRNWVESWLRGPGAR
jgi:hypothetical protein